MSKVADNSEKWVPPSNFEEKIKGWLIPPMVNIKRLVSKELRKGEEELHLLPWLSDKSKISIDVGANRGVYSYLLLGLSKEVIAFEPNPKMFAILEKWARGKVKLYDDALSNKTGVSELRVPRSSKGFSNQGASLSTAKVQDNYKTVEIKTMKLDDLSLDNVGLIKIDVEGFEKNVIEGARDTIKRCKPNLIVEIEEQHNKVPINEMLDYICNLGYLGFAVINGVITPLSRIDLKKHHNIKNHDDYIFNWIFLPKG